MDQAQGIMRLGGYSTWVAGSLPVGAGMPDLLFVSYEPNVTVLADVQDVRPEVLAYLRSSPRARPRTIARKTGLTEDRVERWLERLTILGIVRREGRSFSLSILWRTILPEIVSIEAKVGDWRRCVRQALRNHIFAHRSFVALPAREAERVFRNAMITQAGLGVLGIETTGAVRILRDSRWRQPRVWSYYYRLACLAAEQHSLKERKSCHSSSP